MDTVETTAAIMLIVAASTIFAWILTANQVALHFSKALLGSPTTGSRCSCSSRVIVLVIGCFMETIAAITILTPVLLPVAVKLGIDPVHFGIILILNLMIGLLTPPVGMVLYVLSKVAECAVRALRDGDRAVPGSARRRAAAADLRAGAVDVAADAGYR